MQIFCKEVRTRKLLDLVQSVHTTQRRLHFPAKIPLFVQFRTRLCPETVCFQSVLHFCYMPYTSIHLSTIYNGPWVWKANVYVQKTRSATAGFPAHSVTFTKLEEKKYLPSISSFTYPGFCRSKLYGNSVFHGNRRDPLVNWSNCLSFACNSSYLVLQKI